MGYRPPDPHPTGARPPAIPADLVPQHVAIVMDGDGRWAKKRGLARTEGHKQGESSLLDVIMGAIELGIPNLSAYAFSTENWRRSPDEVRFLMGFNRDVIHRRRDLLNEMGVRIRWAGRRPKLWRSVISELEEAERMSASNTVITLQFCVNYGGRAEITDAAAALAADVAAGRLRPDKITEKVFARYLYQQ
jgi:trans,polycis-polyprenyl diphosphate synthase